MEVEPRIEARGQLVAILMGGHTRCGSQSPTRSITSIPTLMRLLSHRWVTSPARLCALTFTTANTSEGDCNGDGEDEGDWVWPSKQRQLWVRVSHTLGVVDSGWFDTDASLGILSHRCCGSIGSSHIVTQSGESMQVSGLGGERCVEYVGEDPEMSVCCNDRWMVVYGSKLVIWKVNESGLGALVTRNPTLVIDEDNGIEVTLARFSYQRGTDVLMLFCYKHKNDDEKGSPFILCVDLRATLASRSLAVLSERSVNCSTEYHYASDFLEVGGVLYVVLQPLSVQGRMLFCVESGALYRFPQGHAVYTVGGSHFCAFSRNFWDYSQKCEVFAATQPSVAITTFQNTCCEPPCQRGTWDTGTVPTFEEPEVTGTTDTIVLWDVVSALSLARIRFSDKFRLLDV